MHTQLMSPKQKENATIVLLKKKINKKYGARKKRQTYRIMHFFFFLLARSLPRPLLADLSSILRDLISRIKSKNTCKCAMDAISKL